MDTDILVIPKGVKHPEASMEFIAYTQRQDVVEYLATVHCKGSPLAVSSEAFLANHPNKGVRVFDAIAKSPRAFRVPQTRAWLQVRDEFVAALDEVWNLKAPAKEIMEKVQGRAQAGAGSAWRTRRRDAWAKEGAMRRSDFSILRFAIHGIGSAGCAMYRCIAVSKIQTRSRGIPMTRRSTAIGLLWVSPWIIGFVAFMLFPAAMSLYDSFTEHGLLEVAPVGWAGQLPADAA